MKGNQAMVLVAVAIVVMFLFLRQRAAGASGAGAGAGVAPRPGVLETIVSGLGDLPDAIGGFFSSDKPSFTSGILDAINGGGSDDPADPRNIAKRRIAQLGALNPGAAVTVAAFANGRCAIGTRTTTASALIAQWQTFADHRDQAAAGKVVAFECPPEPIGPLARYGTYEVLTGGINGAPPALPPPGGGTT